jgi:hypothetical protein
MKRSQTQRNPRPFRRGRRRAASRPMKNPNWKPRARIPRLLIPISWLLLLSLASHQTEVNQTKSEQIRQSNHAPKTQLGSPRSKPMNEPSRPCLLLPTFSFARDPHRAGTNRNKADQTGQSNHLRATGAKRTSNSHRTLQSPRLGPHPSTVNPPSSPVTCRSPPVTTNASSTFDS